MKIRIGEAEFEASKPADLEQQLLGTLGLNTAEVVEQLQGLPLASTIARAVRPFLGEAAPHANELASAIHDNRDAVLKQARRLYAVGKRKA